MTHYLAAGKQYYDQFLAFSIDRTQMYKASKFREKPRSQLWADYHRKWMPKQFAWFGAIHGGHRNPLLITGTVLDNVGGTVAGATVTAFRASDNAFVENRVSDANGAYAIPTPYFVAHRVIAEKTPNLAGISVNTIVPA